MGKKTIKTASKSGRASGSQQVVRTRLKLGDVIEFRTSKGFAYAQYVFKHTNAQGYGELLRIIEGVSAIPTSDLDLICSRRTLYVCFCRPQPELKSGKCKIVGNAAIPSELEKLPKFKWACRNIISGRVIRWEIWDGKTRKGRPVTKLNIQAKQYPLLEIVTLEDVIHRLDTDWKPEDECLAGATSVFGQS
jgi:hypothetical protein